MRTLTLWILGCVLVTGSARSADALPLVEVRLFNGLTYRGVIVREDDDALLVRTSMGEKRMARHEIVHFRRHFTAEERERILATLPRESVVVGETVARRAPKALTMEIGRSYEEGDGASPRGVAVLVTGRQLDWGALMASGLNRHLSLEFVDTDLDEAINFVATVTRLNIIVSPNVRAKNLKVSLNVKDMDAGSVLRWIARLTDTYIEVINQALYVTDAPSQEEEEAERTEAMLLLTRVGADPAVLPPDGQKLTQEDRLRIALAIWEKENPTPTDFPAPELRLDQDSFLNPSQLIRR